MYASRKRSFDVEEAFCRLLADMLPAVITDVVAVTGDERVLG